MTPEEVWITDVLGVWVVRNNHQATHLNSDLIDRFKTDVEDFVDEFGRLPNSVQEFWDWLN